MAHFELDCNLFSAKKLKSKRMTKTTKEGKTVTILKQYRNQSNNYINNDSKIYADLYKVIDSSGKIGILCQTEILEL